MVRLAEMGFVAGTPVQLVKVAPLGDPLQFRVRGYHISLRRAEAARIRVEPT
ncbi:MAG TPA: FeoA domain-containing protein [Nannocystaceae bacterium]|nr:FeoA domain-containing protein [Nannocystaceae bacterium]